MTREWTAGGWLAVEGIGKMNKKQNQKKIDSVS